MNQQGRTYTSNTAKLLKNMAKLQLIQDGKRPSPVMFHMSICNPCNLTCSFCCFANRNMKEMLTLEQMKKAVDSFKELGTKSVEFSVSADEVVPYFVENELRVDKIDDIVSNRQGQSLTINDNGKHLIEDIAQFIKHKQSEPLFKIILQTGRHIKVTKSHSLFFYEGNKIVYKPVSNAIEGDLVVVSTKPIVGQEKAMDLNYARLLGYFVSEGSFSFQRAHVPHGVHFTFDGYHAEQEYIDDVCNILDAIGYKFTVYYPKENKTTVSVSSKVLCEEFLSLGMGDRSNTRRVPNCIFNTTNDAKIEFLKGLYAGDGCFRNTPYKGGGYKRNSLQLKTSSQILQKTVGFLFQQMSINATFSEGINPKRKIEGRDLPESVYYVVNIDGKDNLLKINDVIKFMGKELSYKDSKFSNTGSRFKPIIISEHVIAIPIKKIVEVEKEEEYVYDLSVGDTHRFISSFGILCHNTGGGEPSLHPEFGEIIKYAHSQGFKIGVCTNGSTLTKWKEVWGLCTWVRLGMYGFDEGYAYDLYVFEGTNTEVSAAYVWDANLGTSKNPNVTGDWSDLKSKRLSKNFQKKENFFKMLDWVEENKIPTRIAFNAIKPASDIAEDLACLRGQLKEWEEKSGKILQHAFLSDFNYKPDRRNDNCYMGMVKPFVFTNGYVYPCPSMELSPENSYMVNDEFKLCDIDGIVDYYNKGVDKRSHSCSWCKYSAQNELIDDILMETKHNDFA